MAKLKGLKLTEAEVSQTLNLEDIFGVSFEGRRDLRLAIGQAFLDRIQNRTESGKNVNGKNLKRPYSDEYADTLKFKAFGKSKGRVNMTLSGGMLAEMDIIEEDVNKVKLGWDNPTQNAKAFNHNTGDTVPRRQFFGVTSKDIKEVKQQFKSDIKDLQEELQEEPPVSAQNILDAIDSVSFAAKLGDKLGQS